MKKIISIVLTVILTISVLPLTVLAEEIEGNLTTETEPIEPIKTNSKTPCYGEYEILIDENEYSTMAAEEKDQYESNNSFSNATRLNSQPSARPANFSCNINASLHRETWFWGAIERNVDEDCYRLDLFGNANVTISLTNIPSGCDYDLDLNQHENKINAKEDDIILKESSKKSSNNNESIATTLSAGTYYLRIYSYNDACNDSVYYNLSVSVSYTAENASISSLKYDKGAKAALWVSDYDPCGIEPCSQSSEVQVGYTSYGIITDRAFENPFTEYFTTREPIEHVVVYVWDIGLRNEIRDILDDLYDLVYEELKNNNRNRMTWEIIEETLSTTTLIISFVDPTTAAIKATGEILSNMQEATSILSLFFAPSDEVITTKENLLNYILNLQTALEACDATGTNEVVRITSTYTYISRTLTIDNADYDFFDFTPYVQEEYLYTSDTIYSWNSSSIVHGTIYGITDTDDISNALNRGNNYLPDVNTSTLKTIGVDSSMPGYINRGEYHWYQFTAPSDGIYAFYTENSFDTYGELFSSIVPARSVSGRLAFNDDGNGSSNFKIEYQLFEGQTVYLRVRGYVWTASGTYSLRVTKQ